MLKNKAMLSFLIIFLYLLKGASARELESRNHYVGTIGNNRVYMDLSINGDSLTGYYFYYKKGAHIELEGSIGTDKGFKLNEYANGNPTGVFTGMLKDLNKLTGQWTSPAADKKFQYELNLIAQRREFKSDSYDIIIEYPQFFFINQSLCQNLNDTLKTFAYNLYRNFAQDINEYISLETPPPFLYVQYSIEYFSSEVISLLFTHCEYTGGAHPNTYYSAFNLLLTGNKITQIELGDLFTKNSNYCKELSDISIAALKNQNASFVIDGEVKDVSDMLDVFNITPTKLVFTFAPYLVGSYAEGTYTVGIPYKDIKAVIDSRGPLARIIRF